MYEIVLRIRHDCPYSRIANLFDVPVYEVCSDLYDLLIIPTTLNSDQIEGVIREVREPSSLEIYTPENNKNLTYLYFNCMCDRERNVVPTIERHGGMVQYPIRYEDGYEYYNLISLNRKTQAAVLGVVDHFPDLDVLQINELGYEGIFKSQFLSVTQLIESLTDKQIEVIVRAHERGYYEIPRGTRTQDLADEFDISRPALEKSLRKAENQILENVIPYLLMHQRLFNSEYQKPAIIR